MSVKPKQQEAPPPLSEAAVVFPGARRGAAGRRGPLFRLAGPAAVTLNPGSQAGEYEYIYIYFFSFQHGCAPLAPPPGADTRSRWNQLSVWRTPRTNDGLHIHAAPSQAPFLEQQPGGATHRHTQTHAETNKLRSAPPNWNLLVSGKW